MTNKNKAAGIPPSVVNPLRVPDTIPVKTFILSLLSPLFVYPLINKIEKKNRSKDELHKVIKWLTGFKFEELEKFIEQNITFESFFMNATLNKNAHLITGTICGIKVEEIKNPITKQ